MGYNCHPDFVLTVILSKMYKIVLFMFQILTKKFLSQNVSRKQHPKYHRNSSRRHHKRRRPRLLWHNPSHCLKRRQNQTLRRPKRSTKKHRLSNRSHFSNLAVIMGTPFIWRSPRLLFLRRRCHHLQKTKRKLDHDVQS